MGNAHSESRGLGGERGRSMMMRYHKDYSVSLTSACKETDSLPQRIFKKNTVVFSFFQKKCEAERKTLPYL